MENQTEMKTNGHDRFWGFLGGVLAGGLLGAGAMLLFAPQSGKRTRAKIQQKTSELSETVTNTVEDALTQTRHKAHQMQVSAQHQAKALQVRGETVLADQKERLTTLVEAGKTTVQSVLN